MALLYRVEEGLNLAYYEWDDYNWPPAAAYETMQQAPGYRRDLDLFIVAPNGEYASFCTIWIDEKNKFGNFEPVGTHTEYQRMGLGRALLLEGFRRWHSMVSIYRILFAKSTRC